MQVFAFTSFILSKSFKMEHCKSQKNVSKNSLMFRLIDICLGVQMYSDGSCMCCIYKKAKLYTDFF